MLAEYLQAQGIEAASLDGGMQAWSLAWNVAEVRLTRACGSYLASENVGRADRRNAIPSREKAHVTYWTIAAS
jgi:hypothetical protein